MMNNAKPEVDVEKEVKIFEDTLKDIQENFDPEKLTFEERESVLAKLQELQEYALKVRALYD